MSEVKTKVAAIVDDVENCDTCPFMFATGPRLHCTHPAHGEEARKLKRTAREIAEDPAPEWCPLRAVPVYVRMKEGK